MKNTNLTHGILGFFGNALEFYEFTIYGVFASVFSSLFFHSTDSFTSLMYSWGIFSVGFFMRPIGAIFFGYIGDTYGRKIALTGSIFLMSISTIGIGFLPGYMEIGIYAPLLLIIFRMLQGVSTGGEYNGAAIFLIEKFGQKPGFIGGIITSSCVLGAILGTFFGKYLLGFGGEFWRLAFFIGGGAGLIVYALRYFLEEPKCFSNENDKYSLGYINFIVANKSKFIFNMIVGGLNGALSYVLFGFSLTYLNKYIGFSSGDSFSINIFGLFIFFIGSIIFGKIYDYFKYEKYMKFVIPYTIFSVILSIFLLQCGDYILALIGIFLWGAVTGAIAGPGHAILQRNIPVKVRYRFVATSFSLGMAIAGGTTPAIITWLIEKHDIKHAPVFWITTITASLFLFYLFENNKKEEVTA